MKETYFNTLIMIFIVGVGLYYMKYYLDKILKGITEKLNHIESKLHAMNVDLEKFKINYEERCKHYEFRIAKVENKLNGEED